MSRKDITYADERHETRRLLTSEQVAEILAVKTTTLAIWRLRGSRGQPLRFVRLGRCVRYDMADVQKFIDSQKRYHTDPFRPERKASSGRPVKKTRVKKAA